MGFQKLFAAACVALLPVGVVAQTTGAAAPVELTADHPGRYVVQRGDTLWDISGRFLRKPWLWPEVWEANPQIRNPHLIYPGDEIRLTYRDGRPILSLRRGGRGGVVKLSPSVRSEPLGAAIPTIPVDAIQQFLARPRVMTDEEIEGSPYIVSVGRRALMGKPGERIYARGLQGEERRYAIFRRGQTYANPPERYSGLDDRIVRLGRVEREREILGVEAIHVGYAVVESFGDPATLLLTTAERELLEGDRLMPVIDEELNTNFYPKPVPEGVDGQIVSVFDGIDQIGELQVVVLNVGRREGVGIGHVLGVYQRGHEIIDRIGPPPPPPDYGTVELDPDLQGGPDGWGIAANNAMEHTQNHVLDLWHRITGKPYDWQRLTLPDQRAGTVMVFRPFERVSYALVLEATREMTVTDLVSEP